MKVLIYVPNLGRATTNGTAVTFLARDISGYLYKEGHEVLIVGNAAVVEEVIEVPYVSIGQKPTGDLIYAYRLAKIVKDFRPHIAYAFMRTMSTNLALSTLFYRGDDTMYVGSVHNTDAYIKYGKPHHIAYRLLTRGLFNRLDYVSGPSKAVLEDLKKTFFLEEKKLVYLPNFFDFSKLEEKSKEEVEDYLPKSYILNVGRLEHQKNQEGLIRAFKRVVEVRPHERLVIVGEGSLRNKLEELIQGLGLEDKVFLLGYRENPWKYYRRAKLFVLSSFYEGFGMVLLEAMYFGVPTISFDIPSSVEVLEGGKCGILVSSFDEGELARAMLRVLSGDIDTSDILERAKNKASEFTPESFCQKLFALYNQRL